jgi:cyanophycinase
LFAIGGAEARMRRRSVLDAFVASAGGTQARIAVVSSASSLDVEVVEVYRGVFTSLGAGQVISLRPESRAEAHDPDLVEQPRRVVRSSWPGATSSSSAPSSPNPFGEAIKEANERGTVVAGTSTGASILAEHMIAFGTGGATPKQRMSQLSAGLGLLRGVDQHFEQRNRYGRLLSLVAQSPVGLGVDEDTAAVIDDGSRLEVIGRGAVTVVDGQNLVSIAFVAKAHVSATGVWGGAARATCWSQFDLTIRTLLAHQTAVPGPEVLQARAAEAELRDVPREIASEGLSRAYQRRLRRNRRS